ncbi:MAG: toprim domain-containing protein, partial [Planctomycetes bacterium]|nr:toprim domain-containing protein [Planctomycetota bacterium]
NGLFWPEDLASTGPLLVCEGPTDTAAMLDLGYDAIGRPSCTGAVDMVIQVVRHLRHRDVVILADADGPGIDGANRLAEAMTEAGRRPKVVRPLEHKDARAWIWTVEGAAEGSRESREPPRFQGVGQFHDAAPLFAQREAEDTPRQDAPGRGMEAG